MFWLKSEYNVFSLEKRTSQNYQFRARGIIHDISHCQSNDDDNDNSDENNENNNNNNKMTVKKIVRNNCLKNSFIPYYLDGFHTQYCNSESIKMYYSSREGIALRTKSTKELFEKIHPFLILIGWLLYPIS